MCSAGLGYRPCVVMETPRLYSRLTTAKRKKTARRPETYGPQNTANGHSGLRQTPPFHPAGSAAAAAAGASSHLELKERKKKARSMLSWFPLSSSLFASSIFSSSSSFRIYFLKAKREKRKSDEKREALKLVLFCSRSGRSRSMAPSFRYSCIAERTRKEIDINFKGT